MQAAVARGDLPAARAEELAAQADYDTFRALEGPNPVNAATLDELASEVPEGASFSGLHAVEQDLWTGQPAEADLAGLAAQAPVAQFLLSRDRRNPGTICWVAVAQLGWTADSALASSQERSSHRGLVDVSATVRAAAAAAGVIAPLARQLQPRRTAAVERRLAQLVASVAALGDPSQVDDTTVLPAARPGLTAQIDATAAPLSALCAALAPYGSAGALS